MGIVAMPLYALLDGQRHRALPRRRAACAECGGVMIAKCGDKVIHHWAHASADANCTAARESAWHLEWKAAGIDGTQEVAVGRRRADVLAPSGLAVEFQASPLTAAEVRAREADWNERLVWVMDGREQYTRGQIEVLGVPGPGRVSGGRIRWAQAPERVRATQATTLIDLDGQSLFYVVLPLVRQGGPYEADGIVVTRQSVIDYVLRGERISFRRVWEEPGTLVKTDVWCRFTGGDLYCVERDACRNPNHRDPYLWPSRG